MGVALGLIIAAAGAILTWAVNADVSGLNVTAVGVILLVVGILIVILDIFWWRSWTWYTAGPPWSRRTYVRDTAGYPAGTYPAGTVPPATGRRTVVDEEVGGPAGPPPP